VHDIINAQSDQVAATQLTVDPQVEEAEVTLAARDLQPDTDLPDLLEREGALLAGELALVPGNVAVGPPCCLNLLVRVLSHALF